MVGGENQDVLVIINPKQLGSKEFARLKIKRRLLPLVEFAVVSRVSRSTSDNGLKIDNG